MATWTSPDPGDGSGWCVRGRIFNADSSPAGDEFIVESTTADNQRLSSATALADGRFVVTWRSGGFDSGSHGDTRVRGRVFNADGTPAGGDFVLNSTTGVMQSAPSVAALADGRFVVTWESSDPGDGSGLCVRGRVFNADGTPDGDDFILDSTTSGDQIFPAVMALADGRFVAAWGSYDDPDFEIRARMFAPTVFGGTAGADFWQGGSFADFIDGEAGNDTLSGNGGNDLIFGISGDDELDGGDDNDRLVGGAGDDTLKGGGGADRLEGQAGDDTLTGGGGADTLDGGAGYDELRGTAGDDRFIFAPGDDGDSIADFVAGAGTDDKVDLTAFSNLRSFDAVLANATQVGGDTVLNFGSSD
ncbi:MAG TPA: hypothetical protein VFX03_12415, partial [Thermomicrobiales bacterium]|nr:hypothetical protein [Thermomicrobiales bacterium]